MYRALFLCPSPFEIGTYFRAIAIAKAMSSIGKFEVDLICTGPQDTEQVIDGVRVITNRASGPNLAPMRGWNFRDLIRRYRFLGLQTKPYDFVYSFEYQPNVWLFAAKIAKRDHAVHFNDWCDWYAGRHHKMRGIKLLQRVDHWMEEYPRKRVDHLTVICQSLYDRAIASGVDPKGVSILREGAERDGDLLSRAEARKRLGLDPDTFMVISMADLGHSVLLDGIESLNHPNAILVVLGRVEDLPREHPKVRLPGRVSNADLHAWLCAADAAWLAMPDTPISHGRLPHKIGHFRLYGLPLVTTRVGDVVVLGDPGIHFASYDGRGFASVTEKLLPLEDEVRHRSIVDAEKIFNWDRILAPLFNQIEDCITANIRMKE